MKFAAKLEANTFEDWPYVEYKALKKALKAGLKSERSTPQPGSPPVSFAPHLRSPLLGGGSSAYEVLRAKFLTMLREQRDVISDFYMAELERNREQVQLLLTQMRSLYRETGRKKVRGSNIGDGGTSTESSLVRAATDLYRRLQQLLNYGILNYTGLVKLAKKFDKTQFDGSSSPSSSAHGGALLDEWTSEVRASPFTSPEAVEEQIQLLEETFAAHFCDGSVQVARATLLVRKERPNSRFMITFGMRVGVAGVLFFWLLWDLCVDVKVLKLSLKMNRDRMWVKTQLPLFRLGGAAVLLQFLWAGCLHIWNRTRINFVFMLDFGPRANTNAALAASAATRTLIFYLLSLLLFTKALIGELPKTVRPGVFPVAMLVITIGSLLLPVQAGAGLLRTIACILVAPCVQVDLVSVLVGDVLTSLVKPLQDMAYAVCYIGSREFLLPYFRQGGCRSQSPFMHEVLVPLLVALPLWFRFAQCLRVYHDSHKRFPALPNAAKYAVSLLVVLFGEVHPALVQSALGQEEQLEWLHFGWIGLYMLATLYTFVWDVLMDWKLGDISAGGLRQRRMFASKSVYYVAIVLDLVLRFGWTATLVPHWFAMLGSAEKLQLGTEWVLPVVSTCELLRRAMWLILRLESEHLHNTEGFRRIDRVPLHFDHALKEQERLKIDKEQLPSRRVEVLVELVVYASAVAILGLAAVSDIGVGFDDGPDDLPPMVNGTDLDDD